MSKKGFSSEPVDRCNIGTSWIYIKHDAPVCTETDHKNK